VIRFACLLAWSIGFLAPEAASAQMIFSREYLTVVSTREAPEEEKKKKNRKNKLKSAELKAQEEQEEKEKNPAPVVTRHRFLVEVHPQNAAQYEWFLNQQNLQDGRGILITLDDQEELVIQGGNVSIPYDVLFVRSTGVIQAIVPDLVLSQLREPLEVNGPAAAVLYLRAGTTKEREIAPGDQVEFRLFSPAPAVLQ
jgi:uncharacterized membrane protein (UPF0127 family)